MLGDARSGGCAVLSRSDYLAEEAAQQVRQQLAFAADKAAAMQALPG